MLIMAPVYFSVTTIAGGSASFSFKVPGTYGGLQPADTTAGRYFAKAEFWCDTPTNGDTLTGLKLTDTDGKLSTAERALCPNYPDVALFSDNGTLPAGLNTGQWIHNNPPVVINPFTPDAHPAIKFFPSELYLSGVFTSGDLSLGKVFRCNILWGRWVNSGNNAV